MSYDFIVSVNLKLPKLETLHHPLSGRLWGTLHDARFLWRLPGCRNYIMGAWLRPRIPRSVHQSVEFLGLDQQHCSNFRTPGSSLNPAEEINRYRDCSI